MAKYVLCTDILTVLDQPIFNELQDMQGEHQTKSPGTLKNIFPSIFIKYIAVERIVNFDFILILCYHIFYLFLFSPQQWTKVVGPVFEGNP